MTTRLTVALAEAKPVPRPPGSVLFWPDIDGVVAPDRLIRRLLGETALACIFGPPGCGKTYLAFDAGLHVALGHDWFGRRVERGAVLYIAAEGATGLRNRIAAFLQRHDIPDDVPFAILPMAPNLGPGGDGVAAILAAVEALRARYGLPVRMIVVDTLARCMGRGDENLAGDMAAFVANCDEIRTATGATLVVIHHSGKDTTRGARGSNALLGAVDTEIEVVRRDDGTRIATVRKQKDGADGDELAFRLDVVEIGTDDDGEAINSCVVEAIEEASPRTPQQRGLTGQRRIVFDALRTAVAGAGEAPPASNHIPASARVVSVEAWRRIAYERLGAEATMDARQKGFKRAADFLVANGFAGIWGDIAWAC